MKTYVSDVGVASGCSPGHRHNFSIVSGTDLFKQALTRIGRHTSAATIHRLNATIDYLEAGRWLHAKGLDTGVRVRSRSELFAMAARELGATALYLEFGVWEGASVREWAQLLRSDTANLHGFDTFVGLPDAWNIEAGVGTFSTHGNVPDIDDSRVEFFPGLFDDTLPLYQPPSHDSLFVNIDSDVYASAATVLRWVEPLLVHDSFVYFDEFSDRAHELRAFDEFLARSGKSFRLVGATKTLGQVLFRTVS